MAQCGPFNSKACLNAFSSSLVHGRLCDGLEPIGINDSLNSETNILSVSISFVPSPEEEGREVGTRPCVAEVGVAPLESVAVLASNS